MPDTLAKQSSKKPATPPGGERAGARAPEPRNPLWPKLALAPTVGAVAGRTASLPGVSSPHVTNRRRIQFKCEAPQEPAFDPRWAQLATRVQPKLSVSAPNDPFEREADTVADQVMRVPDRPSAAEQLALSPASASRAQRKCSACEVEDEQLRRKESGMAADAPGTAPAIVHKALSAPGQPLDSAMRDFFEPRFGQDFSQVRVHTDSGAAESARAVNARAYTVGQDIVFGDRQYAPRTSAGDHLLAHELAHTIQQAGVAGARGDVPGNFPSSALRVARDVPDAGVSTPSAVAGTAAADQVVEALSKPNPIAGVGDYPEVFRILQGLSINQLLTTLSELDRRYQLDIIKFYIGAATASRERIEAAILAVVLKNRGVLSDLEVARSRALISTLDPADEAAIKDFVGDQSFFFLKGEWPGGESDFTVHAGEDDFLITFEMWSGGSDIAADGRVVISPVRISEALQYEMRYWDYRGMPVEKGESYTTMGSVSKPAVPFQQTVKYNRPKFEPVLLQELPEKGATVWTFDWNGDGKPDFGLRIEYSFSKIRRQYQLTARDNTKATSFDYTFIQPDAWMFGYEGDYEPPVRKDDLEFWKTITETAITLIPVVGEVVLLAEAVTGRNIYGEKISTTERAINGVAALLPVAGGIIAKGFAKEGATLAKVAAQLGRSEEEVFDLLRAIDKESAESEKFARWRDKLKAGGKLTADEAIEVRSVLQQIDVDLHVSRAQAQKLIRRYTPETRAILDTPGVVSKLEEISEEARSLIELCESPCLPPAHQLLEADLKSLEKIQKRLGRPGYDRGLKEYFYRRRNAPGGLKKAIEDLDAVKKADLEKFLDAEIIEGRPPGTTLSRDAQGRFVLDRGPNAPKGTVRTVTEYDVRPYGQHSPMTEELRGFFQSHHGIQDKWAQEVKLPGYDRNEAPGILLRDSRGGSPHQTVTARQSARAADRSSRTYMDERKLLVEDLQKAEVPQSVIDRAVAANDEYYGRLYKAAEKSGLTPKDLEKWFGTWKPK